MRFSFLHRKAVQLGSLVTCTELEQGPESVQWRGCSQISNQPVLSTGERAQPCRFFYPGVHPTVFLSSRRCFSDLPATTAADTV